MRHRLAARGLLPQETQTSRGRETGTREARDSFLEARSSTPQWRAPHAGTHADPEVQSWSCAAVAGQGLGRLPGPLGRYPGHGRGVCGPREHQASVRPAPVCFALLCVSHLSPGGLQPLEAQSDHRRPAEHAAQVQGLHAFGHVERHAGQDILWNGSEGCQVGCTRAQPLLVPQGLRGRS